MAKRRNKKIETVNAGIDMSRYDDSKEIVEECFGCDKIFTHLKVVEGGEEGTVTIETKKCRTYQTPATKWPRKNAAYVMRAVAVRESGANGKVAVVEKDIPVVDHRCPKASHIQQYDIIDMTDKTRRGQQKQKKKR